MKNKDLELIEKQLTFLHKGLKNASLVEEPDGELLYSIGYQVWLQYQVGRIKNTYTYIKEMLKDCYFGENENAIDYKKETLEMLGETEDFIGLPKTLPKSFKNYLIDYEKFQLEIENQFGKVLEHIKISKEKGEKLDKVSKEEVIKQVKIVSKRIVESTNNWEIFRLDLVALVKAEKYGKLLDTIFN